MSDATVRVPTGVADGVAAYVREVRSTLADLPAEDVDELTGGMEADLTELAGDCGGDLAYRLGSPIRYAAALPGCRCGWPGRGLRPQSLREYALAFVAVVVSVQLGRGWLRRTAALHPVLVVANVAAVIVAVTAWGSGAGTYCEADAYSPTPGVSLEALRSATSSSMTPAASA